MKRFFFYMSVMLVMLASCAKEIGNPTETDIVDNPLDSIEEGIVSASMSPVMPFGVEGTKALDTDFNFSFLQDEHISIGNSSSKTYMNYSITPREGQASKCDVIIDGYEMAQGTYNAMYPSMNFTNPESIPFHFDQQIQVANNSTDHINLCDINFAATTINVNSETGSRSGNFSFSHKVSFIRMILTLPKDLNAKCITITAIDPDDAASTKNSFAQEATVDMINQTVSKKNFKDNIKLYLGEYVYMVGVQGINVEAENPLTAFVVIPADTDITKCKVTLTDDSNKTYSAVHTYNSSSIIPAGSYATWNLSLTADNVIIINEGESEEIKDLNQASDAIAGNGEASIVFNNVPNDSNENELVVTTASNVDTYFNGGIARLQVTEDKNNATEGEVSITDNSEKTSETQDACNITVNAPTKTVNLNNVAVNTLTVEDVATQTLNVNSASTVKNLVIKESKVHAEGYNVNVFCPVTESITKDSDYKGTLTMTVYDADQLVRAIEGGANVIILANDISVNTTIAITKDLTIDLNGKTLSGNKVRAIQVKSGKLILAGKGTVSSDVENVGSSVIRVGDGYSTTETTSTGTAQLEVGADVTITTATCYGVTVFGTTTNTVAVNGTISTTASANKSFDGCAISTLGTDLIPSTIIVNSGATLTATNTNAIYMPSGNLTVNGGTISGATGIYVKSGTTEIKGGKITGAPDQATYEYYGNGGISTGDAIVVDNCNYPGGRPTVTISGATLVSANGFQVGAYYNTPETGISDIYSTDNTLTVPADYKWTATETSGTYKLVKKTYVAQIGSTKYATLQAAIDAYKTGDVITLYQTVTEVTTLAPDKEVLINRIAGVDLPAKGTILVTTGANLVASKYAGYKDEAGLLVFRYWTVEAEAQLGDTYYESVASAVDKADNQTVKLLKDATNRTISVQTGKTITLDLNGHSITGIGRNGVIWAKNGTKLTITGNGTITATEDSKYSMAVQADGNGTVVTIENGSFSNNITSTGDEQFDLIYATNAATINVNGGVFTCATPKWTLNLKDNSGSTINVTGGTFHGYNPAKSNTEPNGPANFVASGYGVVDGNNIYTVVPQSSLGGSTTGLGEWK